MSLASVRAWWAWWSPRQRRARIAALEAAVTELANSVAVLSGTTVEHHAWLAALVDAQRTNPARYRELRRAFGARMDAMRVRPPTSVADAVPAAEPDGSEAAV